MYINITNKVLEADFMQSQYHEMIKKMVEKKEKRLIVNINHLRTYRPELSLGLLNNPMDYLPAFEQAVTEVDIS